MHFACYVKKSDFSSKYIFMQNIFIYIEDNELFQFDLFQNFHRLKENFSCLGMYKRRKSPKNVIHEMSQCSRIIIQNANATTKIRINFN